MVGLFNTAVCTFTAGSSLLALSTLIISVGISNSLALEWVDSFDDLAVNASNLEAAYHEVTKYLPGVKLEDMAPIMAGIRPKLIGPSDNSFQDFVIREEIDFPRFINLLGIESPGLTSSFAIAKYV